MTIRSFIERLLIKIGVVLHVAAKDSIPCIFDNNHNMEIDCRSGEWHCDICDLYGGPMDIYGLVLNTTQFEKDICAPAVMYRLSSKIITPQQLADSVDITVAKIDTLPRKTQEFLGLCRAKLFKDKFFRMELESLPHSYSEDILLCGEGRIGSTVKLLIVPILKEGELIDMFAVEPATNTYVLWEG